MLENRTYSFLFSFCFIQTNAFQCIANVLMFLFSVYVASIALLSEGLRTEGIFSDCKAHNVCDFGL